MLSWPNGSRVSLQSEKFPSWIVPHFRRVLEELAIQQSALFDKTKAQELGRLAGAFAVLTGTVDKRDRVTSEVNCRLIEVDSGRVLFSESYLVNSISSAHASPGSPTVAGRSASTDKNSFPKRVEAIAHWTLDGNAKNALADSLNGTLIGRPSFERGPVNQALVLNGRDQYCSVAHNDAFDIGQGDFSIALWVRLNENGNAYTVASKGGHNWTKRGWTIDISAGRNRSAVVLETSGGGQRAPGSSQISTNQNLVKSGEWHHIVVSVKKSNDGPDTKIYVDGSLAASGHVDQVSLDNSSADFYIGRIDQYRLSGSVDDVWFLRGAISETEVKLLMGRK